jgi:hypothetical protein
MPTGMQATSGPPGDPRSTATQPPKRASGPLACGRPDYLTFNLSNACYLMSSLKKPYLSKAELVLFELKITFHHKKLF